MQCLNTKNPEVAALLDEYTNILGDRDAAYYVLSENNGYGLDRAPNGAPSKLFSDLLSHYNGDKNRAIQAKAQVYSESFKNWFGDWQSEDKNNVSKVVDENGEPLIVYHGTTEEFDAFSRALRGSTDPGDGGLGFYFSPRKDISEMYGDIIKPVFLSIKNPVPEEKYSMLRSFGRGKVKSVILREKIQKDIDVVEFSIKDYEEKLYGNDPNYDHYREEGSMHNEIAKRYLEYYKNKLRDLQTQLQEKSKEELDSDVNANWNNAVEDVNQYDGVIPNFGSDKLIEENHEMVTRDPNQIKSVDNQGTFSTQDNNIYNQQNALEQDTYEIQRRLSRLQEAYNDISKIKNLHSESFTFRSDAWTYIRRNGWMDVAYVYQDRGKYRIGKYSKEKFANIKALLEESLNDAYYQSLSSDEILSQQALYEQEMSLSLPADVEAEYNAYLQSDQSHEIPMWDDTDAIFNSSVRDIRDNSTGSDKTLVSRLFNNKSRVSAREILAALKGNPAISKMVEILEYQLDTSLKDVSIAYVPYGAAETGAAAQYYHDLGNIVVFGDAQFRGKGNTADITILHELIHAATINKLKSDPLVFESAQRVLDSARKQLSEKYGVSWESLLSRYSDTFYGLTNVYEFFSETFSNSAFILELSSLPAEGETKSLNFLQGIVKWLMNLFAGNRKNSKSLYEQAAGELESVMFNIADPLSATEDKAYKNALFNDESLIFASIQRTSDETKIKQIFTQQSNHINFEADSHTYTNSATGDIYTPVSVVKDLHGYGADISAMSDETLAYGEYAAKVGTAIHDFIHSELTGQKVQPSEVKLADSAKKMIRKVVLPKLMGKNDTLLASEQVISNDSAKIAGTLDLLIKDENGKIHLKDFKTKARTFKGEGKYGFDYYFSAKKETKEGGKPDAARHNYQLTMYKRMLELLGINVDHKEIVPLEYTVNKDGVVTEVWIPELPYAQPDGSIYHRTDNALEQEINQTIFAGDPNATTSDIDSDNLVNQSEIVANILKVLKNQLAISRVKGYTTRAETLKKFIDDLNSMEESEVMVAYINESLKMLKPLIDEYNEGLKAERNGDTAAWNLRKLEAWKNYAESYANLDDIQNYLFLNPNALSFLSKGDLMKIKEALATAINYKNLLENAYKSKGERIWLDWLTPFTSRVEAEYRVAAEREYKKRNKGMDAIRDTAAMNRYIDQYVQSHRNEINLKSRELLRQQSKIATSSPISTLSRWLDNVFESADPIVGSMARAYHTQWMESMQEFNNMYAQLVSLTEELEKAYPSFRSNPAKLYDFMIESDENGSHLISRLSLSFLSAYDKAKKEINANPKYETSKDKAVAIAAWLNDNAPIDGIAALNREKIKVIDDLLSRGRITPKEHKFLINNEKRDQSLKRSWADMVYRKQITEDVADYLRTKFNELNWQYRKPDSKKYPNSKWEALEKVRQSNPQDIRVRFFDFITALDKKGNSFVPERFKLNGRLPGMSKNAAERLVSDGIVSQLARGVRNEFTLTADETDRGMQMTDELDRPIKFVPIYFTNTLPAEEQSLDISTIYKEWFRSVNNYKYINEILPQLEYTKWVIENRKTIKTDSKGNPIKNVLSKVMNNGDSDIDPTTNALISDENLIAQVNAWFDQVIYGVSTRDLGTTMGLDNAKVLNLFQKYTSLKIMGVNVVSMVNNALMAEVQQTMEAFAGQYVSAASYTKASGEYVQDLPNILADVGSRKITSLTNLLNEHFGVFTEFNNGSMLDNNAIKKLSKVSTLYFTTNVGEHEAQSRFLLAALIEKRALDKDGKDIGSMYDYFTVENGKLVFDKEHKVANFSRQDQIAFGQQVTAILRKMHGNYASYSPVALQQYGFGKLLLMFRKWIWATGKRRWAKEYYDEYGQTFSKGYYRDGGTFYYNKVRSFVDRFINEARALEYAEKADWETMTEAEKANVKRFTTEIGIFATLSVMSMLLNYVDTDDDETLDMLLSHLDYQLFRLSTDMTFYISPASFMKIVQSPLPSSSVIKDVSDLFESMLDPFARFEKGDWKGELKIKKRAMDLIPLVRQIYRIRNIDDERQLLSIL